MRSPFVVGSRRLSAVAGATRGGAGATPAGGRVSRAGVGASPGVSGATLLARSDQRGPLATVGAWFVEPAEAPIAESRAGVGRRPIVAVFGLAPRCGATVVARALAVALAARDVAGVAVVSSPGPIGGVPLASRPATRLAAVLADVPGASARAAGRLCLITGADAVALADTACHHAPLVLDAGAAGLGAAAASIADAVALVASPRLEPALARVVASGLARVGPEPVVVLNRAQTTDARWTEVARVLPESRVAARMAITGHESRGDFGRALRGVVESCAASR